MVNMEYIWVYGNKRGEQILICLLYICEYGSDNI